MNKIQKDAVIKEFEKFLTVRFDTFHKEIVFTKLVNTERTYRADYYCQAQSIIIEINGGQWTGGRHTRAGKVKGKPYTQYENDLNKINLAQINGFKVYQFTYEIIARKEYLNIN